MHRPVTAPEPTELSVRAVAARLDIPTATLRSWNRRYGIGPRQERPGRHRLYSERDIAVLTRMVELIRAGSTPAAAAEAARGPVLSFGDQATLLAAAFALDSSTACALLENHLRDYGVVDTWDRLCRPVFAGIVDRQVDGEGCVDVEHLLSWCVVTALHRAVAPTAIDESVPIVLACTSGETHSLPLEVLRAALAERGAGVRMLGPDVPSIALSDTLNRLRVAATVVLWSQQEATALTSAVRTCAEAGARVLVTGPGWDGLLLPDAAHRVATLVEALGELGVRQEQPARA
ncbi:MerR family transcriptional regulator [Nocardia sp. NPDC058058]|uniref:MerR family transcriptional regulator n=1 Tax=Nocardia sp. NPDC058058 TaxID=3346317 RepID=UPI0036DAFA69